MAHSKDKINQTFLWFGVINHPKKENATKADFEAFKDVLNISYYHSFTYAMIVHDKDILEDGSVKTTHAHLYLNTRDKAYSKDELIEKLSNDFSIDKTCIQIDPCNDSYGAIQYLTHKAKKDKHKAHYDFNDIFTNDKEEIGHLWLTDFEVLQQATTYQEIEEMRDLDFIKKYGYQWKEIRAEHNTTNKDKYLLKLYRDFFNRLGACLSIGLDKCDLSKIEDELIDLSNRINNIENEINPTWLK